MKLPPPLLSLNTSLETSKEFQRVTSLTRVASRFIRALGRECDFDSNQAPGVDVAGVKVLTQVIPGAIIGVSEDVNRSNDNSEENKLMASGWCRL